MAVILCIRPPLLILVSAGIMSLDPATADQPEQSQRARVFRKCCTLPRPQEATTVRPSRDSTATRL